MPAFAILPVEMDSMEKGQSAGINVQVALVTQELIASSLHLTAEAPAMPSGTTESVIIITLKVVRKTGQCGTPNAKRASMLLGAVSVPQTALTICLI